jgi:hypothetical protein
MREFILGKNPVSVKEIVMLLAPAFLYLSTKGNIHEEDTMSVVTVGSS